MQVRWTTHRTALRRSERNAKTRKSTTPSKPFAEGVSSMVIGTSEVSAVATSMLDYREQKARQDIRLAVDLHEAQYWPRDHRRGQRGNRM